jgi:methyl coenzyme M reductase subunit D
MSTITERKLKPQTERLYAAIRDEYKKMSSIKKNGKQVFGDDYIIAEIAHKFFKAEKTIEDIVFNRAKVKKMTKPLNITVPAQAITA